MGCALMGIFPILKRPCGSGFFLAAVAGVLVFAPTHLAQKNPVLSAAVIEDSFLRESPTANSHSSQVVLKGTKLRVISVTRLPGWYYGFPEGMQILGYIHGDAIRILKPSKKVPARNRIEQVQKSITLDLPADIAEKGEARKVGPANKKLLNSCPPPLFCPDIGEVHEQLFDNEEKFAKGQFEKTVDGEKRRLTVLGDIRFSDGHKMIDEMIFLYEVGTGSLTATSETYDADTEKWTFPVSFEKEMPQCLPFRSDKSGTLFCLMVADQIGGVDFLVDVQMPPQIAAANKGKIQIGVVGTVPPPHLWRRIAAEALYPLPRLPFAVKEVISLNPKTGSIWKAEMRKIAKALPFDSLPAQPVFGERKVEENLRIVGRDEAKTLVQSTIQTVSEALGTGDFSPFRNSLVSEMRQSRSEAIITEDFRHLLDSKLNNVLVLRYLIRKGTSPTFAVEPAIEMTSGGREVLRVQGSYPLVIGAFDRDILAGFAYGFAGYEQRRITHHSHLLAVRPDYRTFNIGYLLKLAQRERVLEQGIELMTWTFDPLQSVNAYFNFSKLGVVSNQYFVNFYGDDAVSFLHGTGTDRLWVTWLLNSKRVRDRLDGQTGTVEICEVTPLVHSEKMAGLAEMNLTNSRHVTRRLSRYLRISTSWKDKTKRLPSSGARQPGGLLPKRSTPAFWSTAFIAPNGTGKKPEYIACGVRQRWPILTDVRGIL